MNFQKDNKHIEFDSMNVRNGGSDMFDDGFGKGMSGKKIK